MQNRQSVSLGCGTLILIALIVAAFSGAGRDGLQRDIHQFDRNLEQVIHLTRQQNERIEELSTRIDALTRAIEQHEHPHATGQTTPGEQP